MSKRPTSLLHDYVQILKRLGIDPECEVVMTGGHPSLHIKVYFPPNTPDDEIHKVCDELAIVADEQHVLLGGNGLVVTQIEEANS